MTQQAAPDTADAVAAALLRHAAVVPLWIAWLITRLPFDTAPGPVSLVIMAALLFLYIAWVNKPLEVALGPLYAKRPHWSGIFVLPTLFALVILVLDVVATVRAIFHV